MPLKVMTIFGTRPEAVKMAPLVKEPESRAEIQSICCITAQHRQMLDDVLQLFAIQPDYDLDIMEARQSLHTITSKCLLGMEESFPGKAGPALVHGDTSTTFLGAGSLLSENCGGHVEAGSGLWDVILPRGDEPDPGGRLGGVPFHHPGKPGEPAPGGAPEGVFVTGYFCAIDALKTTVRPDYRFRASC